MGKMLGEGAVPVGINYTFGQDAWRLASSNIDAIRQLTGTVVKEFKDRKEAKDAVKVGADKIDAVAKLFGDDSGAFAGIAEQLKDEEIPLSQRAGLASSIDSIIVLSVDKYKSDLGASMEQQRLDLAKEGMAMDRTAFNYNMGRQQTQDARADEQTATADEVAAYMSGPVLKALGVQIGRMGDAAPISETEWRRLYLDDPKTAMAKAQSIIPSTYSVTPVPLYQGARPRGSRSSLRIASSCSATDVVTPMSAVVYPQCARSAITSSCGTTMTTQATRAARSGPSCAGRERMPMRRSPSIALKSFRVMMP